MGSSNKSKECKGGLLEYRIGTRRYAELLLRKREVWREVIEESPPLPQRMYRRAVSFHFLFCLPGFHDKCRSRTVR
jgi:hypothetical protein